jgi:hypothetical protein
MFIQTQQRHPGKRVTLLHKIRNQPKKPATTHGGAATSKFNQSTNNRYQKTWHTIEFSNNKYIRLLARPVLPHFLACFPPSLRSKAYFTLFSLVKSSVSAIKLKKN